MKKLLFVTFGLVQACVVSDAVAQFNGKRFQSKDQLQRFSGQLSQQILSAQTEAQIRAKGDQPLSIERRIVKQEIFEIGDPMPIGTTDYGYVGSNYGLKFDRTFFLGFPQSINASKVNELFFSYNSFDFINNDDPSVFYNPYTVGVNVLADTLTINPEGETQMKYIAHRNTDLSIQSLLLEEMYTSTTYLTKTENIYSNNRIAEVNTYYGENSPSSLELEEKRKISYNAANNKVATDTTFYYDNGVIDGSDYFEYSYDANGKLVKLKYIDTASLLDSAVILFDYYTNNGLLKAATVYASENGVPVQTFKDSVGYNNAGYVNYRKSLVFDEDESMEQAISSTFDGSNRLDSVKIYFGYDSDLDLEAIGKYHYNTDNNPDSLSLFDPADLTESGVKYLFHYQPFNTTSTKTLAKNKDGFNIYPNPINGDNFNVHCKNELKNRNAQITVVDIKGSKIFSTNQQLTQGNNTINIPTVLAPGNYFVEIVADQSVFTQKILKL